MNEIDIYHLPLWLSGIYDEIQEPKNLTILEWQALERFMALEEDRRDFEAIQIYLFGCQHTLAMLQLLKII